jgi:NAD(P)-dependent dehydrogenase (short-subunit alcohol dehydrogenase family)
MIAGVCVLPPFVAAFEGQIGQIPYAACKAGIVGMTSVTARDLVSKLIRVCTIAPGIFDTPLLGRRPQHILDSLTAAVRTPVGSADRQNSQPSRCTLWITDAQRRNDPP